MPPNCVVSQFNQTSATEVSFIITSQAWAPYAWLETALVGRFSQNGFLLAPGTPTKISFIGWAKLLASELEADLKLMTIYDTI
jgi:hypothetical protein